MPTKILANSRAAVLAAIALTVGCDDASKSSAPAPRVTSSPAVAPRAPAVSKVAAPIAPPTPDAAEPVLDVTARKLFADYDANEVSADDKYKGKMLRVTGVITRIAKDIEGKPFAALATGHEVLCVQAMLADDKGAAALKKGEKLVVRCRGEGKMGNVIVDDCAIEHVYTWVPAR